jgi:hypothetical protein
MSKIESARSDLALASRLLNADEIDAVSGGGAPDITLRVPTGPTWRDIFEGWARLGQTLAVKYGLTQ